MTMPTPSSSAVREIRRRHESFAKYYAAAGDMNLPIAHIDRATLLAYIDTLEGNETFEQTNLPTAADVAGILGPVSDKESAMKELARIGQEMGDYDILEKPQMDTALHVAGPLVQGGDGIGVGITSLPSVAPPNTEAPEPFDPPSMDQTRNLQRGVLLWEMDGPVSGGTVGPSPAAAGVMINMPEPQMAVHDQSREARRTPSTPKLTALGQREYEALAQLVVDIEEKLGCDNFGSVADARKLIMAAIDARTPFAPVDQEKVAAWLYQRLMASAKFPSEIAITNFADLDKVGDEGPRIAEAFRNDAQALIAAIGEGSLNV